jgi:hypothetical protein
MLCVRGGDTNSGTCGEFDRRDAEGSGEETGAEVSAECRGEEETAETCEELASGELITTDITGSPEDFSPESIL